MSPSAQERWTARILGATGARPVGHADPADDGPQVPVTPPAPTVPAPAPARTVSVPQKAGKTIPRWWDTRPRPPVGPDTPVEQDEGDDVDEVDEVEDEEVDEEKPAPATGGPVEKVATDGRGRATRKKTGVRKHAETLAGDGRMRIVAFNLSAGLVGKSLGLVDIIAVYLPAAEQAAVGVFGLVLAVGGAVAVWKIAGHPGVKDILPYALICRCLLTALAAEGGRNLAPIPVAYLNGYGEKWGLGPSTISLLITAGGICGLMWWGIDRRIRRAHWTVRWLFRIPLASALLACALHTGTPVA